MSDQQMSLSRLTDHATKELTPLSDEFLSTVGHQLRKLSRVFRRELDETEILTYMEQLRDLPPAKIEQACSRALQTLKRMPTIADIRELANEQGTEAVLADRGPGKFCVRCYPDGYCLDTHPFHGYPYKVARRCPCQEGK